MARGEGEDLRTALGRYVEALPSGEPPAPGPDRRQRVVPRLRAHAAREHVRVRRVRFVRRASLVVTALGGAAVALAIAMGSLLHPAGPARSAATVAVLDGTLWLDAHTGRRTLSAGQASGVDGSDVLESPNERETRVQLADTATLTLGPASRVGTVLAAANAPEAAPTFEAVKLIRGRAHLQVRKLHAGQRFHVLTPDADVQVRGTEFDVELVDRATGHPVPTCVRVQEGLVAVVARGETHLVAPGQTWGCAAEPTHAAPPPAPEVTHQRQASSNSSSAPPYRPSPSDLRLQNAMFQQALEAERAGRYADAARLYRRLLSHAPHGPLSVQARANLAACSRAP
jgi:hypothetical protein